jgi:SPP1 family predicted phage head-tail adaptor
LSVAAAGQRDVLVTIEGLTEGAAASGLPTETFAELGSPVWMHKRQASGNERFGADQWSASATTVWEMPYRCDMDPDLVDVAKQRRLTYKGRVYNIVGAALLRRGGPIQITTLAKVG